MPLLFFPFVLILCLLLLKSVFQSNKDVISHGFPSPIQMVRYNSKRRQKEINVECTYLFMRWITSTSFSLVQTWFYGRRHWILKRMKQQQNIEHKYLRHGWNIL